MLYNFSIMIISQFSILIFFFIIQRLRINEYNKRLIRLCNFYVVLVKELIPLSQEENFKIDERGIRIDFFEYCFTFPTVKDGIEQCLKLSEELKEMFDNDICLWQYETWSVTARKNYMCVQILNEHLKKLLEETAEQ